MTGTRRIRTVAPRSIVVVLTLVAGACKGPVAPLDIGSKDVALDMLIGAKKAVAGAPLPPVLLPTDANGLLSGKLTRLTELEYLDPPPSPPRRPTPTTLPPGACPERDPLAAPKRVADNRSLLPPVAQKFQYRTIGTFDTGGHVETLPTTAVVEVLNPKFDATALQSTWDVAVTLGVVTTTTSYKATFLGTEVPRNTVPDPGDTYTEEVDNRAGGGGHLQDEGGPNLTIPKTGADAPPYPDQGQKTVDENARPNKGAPAGLYITKIQSSEGLAPFQPAGSGLMLAKFPLTLGDSFDSAATDGLTTMSFRSTVLPKATVDACGTPLDSWTIQLTKGRIVTANGVESASFNSQYQLGTQYGSLILSDTSTVTGTQLATGIIRQIQMQVTREPKG